jgi:hypothetical protein
MKSLTFENLPEAPASGKFDGEKQKKEKKNQFPLR